MSDSSSPTLVSPKPTKSTRVKPGTKTGTANVTGLDHLGIFVELCRDPEMKDAINKVDFNAIADKTGAASGASIKKTLQNLVKNRKTLKMDRGKVKTKGRKRAAGSGSDDSGDEAINDGAGGLNAGAGKVSKPRKKAKLESKVKVESEDGEEGSEAAEGTVIE